MPIRPLQQIVEVAGSESPSSVKDTSKINRVRQDLSRARLRAIESSLENGHAWIPPSPSHRKTWEEEVISSYCYLDFLSKRFLFFHINSSRIYLSFFFVCRHILDEYCMIISFSEG